MTLSDMVINGVLVGKDLETDEVHSWSNYMRDISGWKASRLEFINEDTYRIKYPDDSTNYLYGRIYELTETANVDKSHRYCLLKISTSTEEAEITDTYFDTFIDAYVGGMKFTHSEHDEYGIIKFVYRPIRIFSVKQEPRKLEPTVYTGWARKLGFQPLKGKKAEFEAAAEKLYNIKFNIKMQTFTNATYEQCQKLRDKYTEAYKALAELSQ